MIVLRRVIFFFLLWVALWSGADSLRASDALGPSHSVRFWQTEDGLSHNFVKAIVQTRDGYLWIGTKEGVARFDGVKFTVFNSKNTPELRSHAITALSETRDGALWIGTRDGVTQWKNGAFRHFDLTNGLAGNVICTLFPGRDDTLWVGTTEGVCRFENGQFDRSADRMRIPTTAVLAIAEDEERNIYFGTDQEQVVSQDGRPLPFAEGRAWIGARTLHLDRAGSLWAGAKYSLIRLDARSKVPVVVDTGISQNLVSAIHEDRRGNLWVGTYAGLIQLTVNKAFNEIKNGSESFGLVNAICEDHEGNIWVGTRDGLARVRANRFMNYTRQHGLAHNHVTCVMEDRGKTLWIGTWGGGLNRMNSGSITPLEVSPPAMLITTVFTDRSNEVWFSSNDRGILYRHNPAGSTSFDPAEGYIDRAARVVCQDASGDYWIGTRNALCQFDGRIFTRYTAEQGMAGQNIRDLCPARSGDLWIGTDTGLVRKRGIRFEHFTAKDGLSADAVLALHEDAQGVLWIGTRGGGLNCFRDGRFHHFTTRDGFFSDEIWEIVEDDEGWLWMTSAQQGIFCVDKESLLAFADGRRESIRCHSYRKEDGLATMECSTLANPSAWKAADGRLWFATTKGLAVIDPRSGKETNPAPAVVIEEVMADKKAARSVTQGVKTHDSEREKGGKGAGEISPFPPFSSAPLLIPPGRGELEFHYTALSFTAPERNQFKYKLEGFDSDWVEAGKRRIAYYNNLAPGAYNFRVIACNNDDVWNSVGTSMKLRLQPHFWQTWWFRGVFGIAAIGLVGGVARYATRKKMELKLERLEQQHAVEKERTRIARDMHDDLGSHLTQITLLSDATAREAGDSARVTSHATQISSTARDLVQSMEAILWAVNPKNDTLEKLANYIFLYAEKFFSLTSIRCRFDCPSTLPACTITAEIRHNVFLIVKEALNNVLKHANATEVWLRLSVVESTLRIIVEDNGKGFRSAEIGEFRSGLANMRKRMEDIRGAVQIDTEPETGTKIILTVKLRPQATDS